MAFQSLILSLSLPLQSRLGTPTLHPDDQYHDQDNEHHDDQDNDHHDHDKNTANDQHQDQDNDHDDHAKSIPNDHDNNDDYGGDLFFPRGKIREAILQKIPEFCEILS